MSRSTYWRELPTRDVCGKPTVETQASDFIQPLCPTINKKEGLEEMARFSSRPTWEDKPATPSGLPGFTRDCETTVGAGPLDSDTPRKTLAENVRKAGKRQRFQGRLLRPITQTSPYKNKKFSLSGDVSKNHETLK